MKKLLSALLLCTAILCGCSAKGGKEISETSATETSSVTTVTEAETTTAATTSAETAEEEIILTPIPSKEPFEVMACRITDDIMNDKEEDFPDKEALKFAREICFADELIRNSIDESNIRAEDFYSAEEVEAYRIKSTEDLMFINGCTFDFDSDGEDESLICLGYTQPEMGGNALIYIDGEKYTVLESHTGRETSAKVISAGEYIFLLSYTESGESYYCDDIYSFKRGMPEKATNFYGAHSIYYENGAFYCESEFWGTFPFVLCGDGIFRQLGFEWISREDFEAQVKNGGAYLDKLAKDGDEVTAIYTYGHYIYMLYGKGFCYNVQYDDGFVIERQDSDGIGEGIRFTDDVIRGGDVWAVQTTRSQDYD